MSTVTTSDIEVGGSIVFSSSNRSTSYTLSSPLSTGQTSLSLTLPSTQGTDGQFLVKSGGGSVTMWSSPVSVIPSTCKALFSSAFISNNGSEFIQFAGNGADTVVCRFYYQGSAVVPITSFVTVLDAAGGSPTGAIKIKNGSTVLSSISFTGITTTPTIYTSALFANVPSTPTILTLEINVASPSTNKINVYSMMLQ